MIAQLVAGARVGQSGVLLLVGEAGIGKTALLDFAAGLADGMSVLRASGDPAETGIAFGGLLQLLRPTARLIPSLPAPQAHALEVVLALRAGEVGDRFAIGAAALSLLSRYGEDQPVVVLIDDAHDLDPPSAEAILFVARRLLADRVAVVLATRPGGTGPVARTDLPILQIDGLDAGAAGRLLAERAAPRLSIEQSTRLYQATGGNPLALLELAGDLEALERTPPQAPPPVPETVARVYSRRLGDLSEAAQTALLVAAVVDGDLALTASACASLGVDPQALAEAEASDLVAIGLGVARFRHPLVRSAVYAAASPERRRLVHHSVAAVLPASDVERRAWNLSEATVGADESVAGLVESVATTARQRGAYADAATLFERAALVTPTASPWPAERFAAAGESAWLAGQSERAVVLLDRAFALATTKALLTRVRGLQATVAARTGSLQDARSLLLESADGLESADPDAAVVLLADAIGISFFMADVAGGLDLAERVEGLLPQGSSARTTILGNLAVGIGRILAGSRGIDNIRAAIAELADAPWFEEDPVRAGWLVLGPLFLRESDTGRDLVRRAVDDRRERAALGSLPFLLFGLARDDATTDRWSRAEIGYQEAVRLARETGQTTDLGMCLAGLAWLLARSGRTEECRACAEEAMDICAAHQIHLGTVWAGFALAELELGLGRAGEAVRRFAALAGQLEERGLQDADLSPSPDLVDALLRTGDRDEAAVTARSFHALAAAKRQPWAMARAERALGATCDAGDFEWHFLRALELHRGTNDLFELARTELAFGTRLRREKRRADARSHLTAALRAFDRLGARPWADMASVEVAATGGPVARQGEGLRHVLTSQELQIAMMLGGEGRTTKQAAAALFLSPKTVEYHLRHVYTKLDIGSREELRRALAQAEVD